MVSLVRDLHSVCAVYCLQQQKHSGLKYKVTLFYGSVNRVYICSVKLTLKLL